MKRYPHFSTKICLKGQILSRFDKRFLFDRSSISEQQQNKKPEHFKYILGKIQRFYGALKKLPSCIGHMQRLICTQASITNVLAMDVAESNLVSAI